MGNKVINTTSVKLGIYETTTDPQLEGMLGTPKEMEDGRKFRLCRNSVAAALTPGLLIQAKADTDYSEDLVVATTSTAGATTLVVTVTTGHEALSVNELKDGYFCASGTSGEFGHGRKIKSNTAAAAGANTTLTFYDALTDTITAATVGAWIFPIWKDVITDVGTAKVIGAPVCDVPASVAATGYYYFWAQVKGACPLLSAATLVRGDVVVANGAGTTGTVIPFAGDAVAFVGTAMQAVTASGDFGWVWLNIE